MIPPTTLTEVFYMAEGRLVASGVIHIHPEFSSQLAYFCTTCGKIWGQVLIPSAPSWQVFQVPCRRHKPLGVPDWGAIPGSFTQRKFHSSQVSIMDWARCLDRVPSSLVEYEFHLSLNSQDPDGLL
jgi:hypothetical protein